MKFKTTITPHAFIGANMAMQELIRPSIGTCQLMKTTIEPKELIRVTANAYPYIYSRIKVDGVNVNAISYSIYDRGSPILIEFTTEVYGIFSDYDYADVDTISIYLKHQDDEGWTHLGNGNKQEAGKRYYILVTTEAAPGIWHKIGQYHVWIDITYEHAFGTFTSRYIKENLFTLK